MSRENEGQDVSTYQVCLSVHVHQLLFLEIKEQDSCLESQGIHIAAEPVVHEHLAITVGAVIGMKVCWGKQD